LSLGPAFISPVGIKVAASAVVGIVPPTGGIVLFVGGTVPLTGGTVPLTGGTVLPAVGINGWQALSASITVRMVGNNKLVRFMAALLMMVGDIGDRRMNQQSICIGIRPETGAIIISCAVRNCVVDTILSHKQGCLYGSIECILGANQLYVNTGNPY
jgi:hypothetical protein